LRMGIGINTHYVKYIFTRKVVNEQGRLIMMLITHALTN
jgi:hypothetical protein